LLPPCAPRHSRRSHGGAAQRVTLIEIFQEKWTQRRRRGWKRFGSIRPSLFLSTGIAKEVTFLREAALTPTPKGSAGFVSSPVACHGRRSVP
jgi:hypothetical protein